MQYWRQIHEHEAVISFEQNAVGELMTFHPIWMPDFLTEAQKDAILSFTKDYAERYQALDLVTDGGRIIGVDEVIKVCNEKMAEQDKEISDAYDEFKKIEEMLEYSIDDQDGDNDKKEQVKLAERYLELSEKYGFERQFEIEMADEPTKDMKNERNDFNMDK